MDAILTAVQAVIQGVSGAGQVHTYERHAPTWDRFLELFRTGDAVSGYTIAGWMITRTAAPVVRGEYGETFRCHVLRLRGLRGLDDSEATEKAFQAHLDDVSDAFLADHTLGGAVFTTHPEFGPMSGTVGLDIADVQNRMFGKVLCHSAEGRLCCVEELG